MLICWYAWKDQWTLKNFKKNFKECVAFNFCDNGNTDSILNCLIATNTNAICKYKLDYERLWNLMWRRKNVMFPFVYACKLRWSCPYFPFQVLRLNCKWHFIIAIILIQITEEILVLKVFYFNLFTPSIIVLITGLSKATWNLLNECFQASV